MAGGAILLAMTAMIVLSVTGRALLPLGLGPIYGDVELVEAGAAVAAFAFLPWATRRRAHARVDLLAHRLGPRPAAALEAVADTLMAAAAAVIAWRLALGAIDRHAYGDLSYILQFSWWPVYVAALFGAAAFAVTAAWTLTRSVGALLRRGDDELDG